MLTSYPFDTLLVAERHQRELRAAAAAERLRVPLPRRRRLAVALRHAADRLDPAPLRRGAAGRA